MRSSTVRREKLLSPWHIGAIVALFVAAFVVLAPGQRVFQVASDGGSAGPQQPVDSLTVAYLKARQYTAEKPEKEVAQALTGLLHEGRLQEARELLVVYPALSLSAGQRYLLDLELAAAEWISAQNSGEETAAVAARMHFVELLSLPARQPELQSFKLLNRALTLSESLSEPSIRFSFYQQLAALPAASPDHWFKRCGDDMASSGQHRDAISCFESIASVTDETAAEQSAVLLPLLKQYYIVADRPAIERTQTKLLQHTSLQIEELTAFAALLLANNRPDLAHGVYAQLANREPDKQRQWLEAAARWAEAANQPQAAVAYLQPTLSGQSSRDRSVIEARIHALLLAAGDNEAAIARLAESVERNPDDVGVLRRAIPVVRQLGEPVLAVNWNERILYQYPYDLDALKLQVELTQEAGDLSAAQRWAERLVDRSPENTEARQALARITEWNGDPWTASEHWSWLVEREPRNEAVQQVVRLAGMTLQPHLTASALRKLGQHQNLDHAQVKTLIAAYELEGRPDQAAVALRELEAAHGTDLTVLRELAQMHYRHKRYRQALSTWEQVWAAGDHSSTAALSLMELNWRLNEPEKALEAVRDLPGKSLLTDASAYQVRLVSELAWRYRIPELGLLVQPGLTLLDDEDQRRAESERLIANFKAAGQPEQALDLAVQLWDSTAEIDYGILALTLAADSNNNPVIDRFLENNRRNRTLHNEPEYWNLVAAVTLRRGATEPAEAAYQRALKLDPPNVDALAGLLWLHIGTGNAQALAPLLEQHQQKLEQAPTLWSAAAVAYLSAGDTRTSLLWFARARNAINADYGLLLTYADALEFNGQARDALALRSYALRQLRPLLEEGSRPDRDMLLQQYARATERFRTASDSTESAAALLRESTEPMSKFWREDMAIAWLMATQQHEHARLVMAGLHRQRLRQPQWQSLAVAMKTDDVDTVTELLRQGEGITVGDQMLALRQLGRDDDVWRLAQTTLAQPRNMFDRATAKTQFLLLRSQRPSYAGGQISSLSLYGLDAQETGFKSRHTLLNGEVGFGLDLKKRRYRSNILNLEGREQETDVAISLFAGDRRRAWQLTGGFLSDELSDETYAVASYKRQNRKATRGVQAIVAYQEQIEGAAELRLASLQDRGSVILESDFGSREFFRLQTDVTRLSSRVQKNLISRGLRAAAEVGIRGALGSHSWTSSLMLQSSRNDREEFLPVELMLQDASSIDSVLVPRASSVALGFSLRRGDNSGALVQQASPRYYLQANVGHYWPEETIAVQLNAGAGIRVLGGDELGFSFSHDTRPAAGESSDATQLGLNYRYHF